MKNELENGIHNGEVDDGISSVDDSADAMSDHDTDEEVFIHPKIDKAGKNIAPNDNAYSKYRAKPKVPIEGKKNIAGSNHKHGSFELNANTSVSWTKEMSVEYLLNEHSAVVL